MVRPYDSHTGQKFLTPSLPHGVAAVAVDLDGTLIWEESHQVLLWSVIKNTPAKALKILKIGITEGRPAAKEALARACPQDVRVWTPYAPLVQVLQRLHAQGMPLVLITGAPAAIAKPIFQQMGFFTHLLHSTPDTNLVGPEKSGALRTLLNDRPFIYVGNSLKDLAVWRDPLCVQAWAVRPSRFLTTLASLTLASPLVRV